MRYKFSLWVYLMFFCGTLFSAGEKFVIVIDPGHGGRDPGAVRGKVKEKDITLAVSLQLGRIIENNHKDVKVIYTRKTDETLILADRAKKANQAKANLFFSIHVNSSKAKETKAKGAETYIMGVPKNAEDQAVAILENSVILQEENYKARYEGFDPNSTEFHILSEFMYNRYRDQSIDLASDIQAGLRSKASRFDRGVKENFFLVLRTATMPSVLIEMGFINNSNEVEYITSKGGQKEIAEAIYQGFKKYKQGFDKRQGGTTKIYTAAKVDQEDKTVKLPKVTVADTTTVVNKANPDKVTSRLSEEYIVDEEVIEVVAKTKPTIVVEKVPEKTPSKETVGANDIEYRVQFLVVGKKLSQNSSLFRGLSPEGYYIDNDRLYKYTYGSTSNQNDAAQLLRKVKAKFPDAFIVKFKNGKRIK